MAMGNRTHSQSSNHCSGQLNMQITLFYWVRFASGFSTRSRREKIVCIRGMFQLFSPTTVDEHIIALNKQFPEMNCNNEGKQIIEMGEEIENDK